MKFKFKPDLFQLELSNCLNDDENEVREEVSRMERIMTIFNTFSITSDYNLADFVDKFTDEELNDFMEHYRYYPLELGETDLDDFSNACFLTNEIVTTMRRIQDVESVNQEVFI